MNETDQEKNRLAKRVVLLAADLLEHFQWGKQSVSDHRVRQTIEDLEKELEQLKQNLRD